MEAAIEDCARDWRRTRATLTRRSRSWGRFCSQRALWRAVRENEQHYGAEARERYGNEAVDAMNERILDMDPATWTDMKELEKAILGQLSIALVDGATGPEAAKLTRTPPLD